MNDPSDIALKFANDWYNLPTRGAMRLAKQFDEATAELRERLDTAEKSAEAWEADALLRAQNTDFWKAKLAKSEAMNTAMRTVMAPSSGLCPSCHGLRSHIGDCNFERALSTDAWKGISTPTGSEDVFGEWASTPGPSSGARALLSALADELEKVRLLRNPQQEMVLLDIAGACRAVLAGKGKG
jgi:hypothetical protein